MQERTIFIGGAERTGTYALNSVLCSSADAHPLVNECQYLTTQLSVFRSWYNQTNRFDTFLAHYLGSREQLKGFTKSIIEQFLLLTRNRLNPGKHLVLKSPGFTEFFPILAELFPEALFIVNVRDPRDAIASLIDVAQRQKDLGMDNTRQIAMDRDMEQLSDYFLTHYEVILNGSMDPYQARVLYNRYEDLMLTPQQTIPQIGAFCEMTIPVESANQEWNSLVNFQQGEKNPLLDPWKTQLNGGKLSDSSIGRYRDKLTTDEILIIDARCQDYYTRFGYTPHQKGAAQSQKATVS